MCAVDWGLIVGALAAVGTFVAAGAALWIAPRDRRERQEERDNAAFAQARLVQVQIKQVDGAADFAVEIQNYGDQAIIGAAVTSAWWFGHPEHTWQHSDIDRLKIVQPARDVSAAGSVRIRFHDPDGNVVPTVEYDAHGNAVVESLPVLPDAVIVFMDANGDLWQTGSAMAPERISSAPTSDAPFGPHYR